MSLYYCNICDRRTKFLKTPLYKALVKCSVDEYIFKYQEILKSEKFFIKYNNLHSETGVYSIP